MTRSGVLGDIAEHADHVEVAAGVDQAVDGEIHFADLGTGVCTRTWPELCPVHD
jgi:hypothetical protein